MNIDAALYTERVSQNTIRIYSRPLKYRDADGKARAIDLTPMTETRDGATVFAARRNTAEITVRESGAAEVAAGGETVTTTPLYLEFDNAGQTRIPLFDRRKTTRLEDGRTLRASGVAPGFDLEYVPIRGGVKETLRVLEKPAMPREAENAVLAWGVSLSDGLSLDVSDGNASILRGNEYWGGVRPLVCVTGDGRRRRFPYQLGKDGSLQAMIPLDFLRNAVYPLEIDPTIETGLPTGFSVRGTISSGDYNRIFLKWPKPAEVEGATITSATLYTKAFIVVGDGRVNVGFYGPTAAWDVGDSGPTLWAIPLGTQLASRVYQGPDHQAIRTYDVLGDSSWGILAQHAIAGRDYYSIFIDDLTGTSSRTTKDSSWCVGNDQEETDLIEFDAFTHEGYPYLELTYEGGGTPPASLVLKLGASAGVLSC